GQPPEPTKPARSILERIVDIDQQRATELQLSDARTQSGSRVRDVVKDAQCIAEVHRGIGERNVGNTSAVEVDVAECREAPAGDFERLRAGLDAMQPTDARGDSRRPAAASASQVKPLSIRRQARPGEDVEVRPEMALEFLVVEA